MPPRKKKDQVEDVRTQNDKFQSELDALGIGGSLVLAEDLHGLEVVCYSTGFPELDIAISQSNYEAGNGGLPLCRHSEWYSKKESAGKTSILLKIAAHWQSLGRRVGIGDVEQTILAPYLRQNGLKLTREECGDSLYPVRLLRSQFDFNDDDTPEKVDLYADDFLGIIKKAMNVFDLLIVDSIDALASKDDAEKEATQNRQVGGISKKLSAFFRENKNYRSHVAWANQTRQTMGYSPSGNPVYVTSGGRALPFYASLRFELTRIHELTEAGKDDSVPYGIVTRFKVIKNKLAPHGRFVDLYYINGEGFSTTYSYFLLALKLNIIWKAGAWHYFGIPEPPPKNASKEVLKVHKQLVQNCKWKAQGQMNMYRLLRENPEFFAEVKQLIDGETVEETVGEDLTFDVEADPNSPEETLDQAPV